MTSELPRAVKECPNLAAENSDRCTIHRDYDKVAYSVDCVDCKRKIRVGTWFRRDRGGSHHSPTCPPKREKKTEAANEAHSPRS